MTTDQRKDYERNRRYAAREGLLSLMNDTKWREVEALVAEVFEKSGWPRCRRKDIREPFNGDYWDSDRYHVFGGDRFTFEWIDIDPLQRERLGSLANGPTTDQTEVLAVELRRRGVPFTRENGFLRIWGHARPGQFPQFKDFEPRSEH